MINVYKIRKWGAMLIVGFFAVTSFAVGMIFYNFWIALMLFGCAQLVAMLAAHLMLKNPFSNMLEGKGVLAASLDSTGIFKFFNLTVKPPYMEGKFNAQRLTDIFDREAVFNMEAPGENEGYFKYNENGSLDLHLNRNLANKGQFGALHYPLIIWNDALKTVITKGWISEKEKDSFVEHGLLYLNRKVEDLTSIMRDFARHVVETTRPKGSLFENKWAWIAGVIVIIGIVVVLFMFAPAIITTFQSAGGGPIGQSLNAASGTVSAITPAT